MELHAYQQTARKTLQPGLAEDGDLTVPLLGLIGEAGAVATAYKKQLRDGAANPTYKAQLREEIGDALWYLAILADRAGLDLDDVATANLHKVADRWRPTAADQIPFDEDYPAAEQLPRQARFTFTTTLTTGGRSRLTVTCNDQPVGDPLTDASHIDDHYRLHDVFHLAHAAVLGWSPVLRSLMKRKRRSNPDIDLAEDGGRAIAIEEGISALVFAYASEHNYLNGKTHIDNGLLDTIRSMVGHLEVSTRRAADWEKAILTGYTVWRQLRERDGGVLDLDMTTQALTVVSAMEPMSRMESH